MDMTLESDKLLQVEHSLPYIHSSLGINTEDWGISSINKLAVLSFLYKSTCLEHRTANTFSS